MNRSQRHVLRTACLSHGLIHVYMLCVPALLVLIQQEFGVGDLPMGQVVTIYGLLFGFGALPSGFLVDRFGSTILLTCCLWGASISIIGMAASPSLSWFVGCAALMGLFLSIYHPAGTALITHALPPTGRVFALHGMAGNAGVAGASAIAGVLGALVGWRMALGLLAGVGLVLGIKTLGLPTPALHEIKARPGRGRWSRFLALLVATGFMGMVYRGVTTFLPKFLGTAYVEEARTSTRVGGLLAALALFAGLLGMYVAGKLVDRGRAPARVFLAGALFQVPFLVSIGTIAGGVALVPLAMGFAFFHFLTQPAGNYMVASFMPPRLRGMGYGIYFFMTFGVGALGAWFSGWVSERADLSATFPALALLLVPPALAMIALSVAARKSESDRPA